MNALKASDSFVPGTNFQAWMHRILRNRFISNLRKRRDTTDIADVPDAISATGAAQGDRLVLKELGSALNRLPSDQREALVLIVVHGISYEELGLFPGAVSLEGLLMSTFLPGWRPLPTPSCAARSLFFVLIHTVTAKF